GVPLLDRERLFGIMGSFDLVSFFHQELLQGPGQAGIVVHHQHRAFCRRFAHTRTFSGAAALAESGNSIRTTVPCFGTLSMCMEPSCSWRIVAAIDSPSPVPLPTGLVVKNGSQMCGKFTGSMPQPSSS